MPYLQPGPSGRTGSSNRPQGPVAAVVDRVTAPGRFELDTARRKGWGLPGPAGPPAGPGDQGGAMTQWTPGTTRSGAFCAAKRVTTDDRPLWPSPYPCGDTTPAWSEWPSSTNSPESHCAASRMHRCRRRPNHDQHRRPPRRANSTAGRSRYSTTRWPSWPRHPHGPDHFGLGPSPRRRGDRHGEDLARVGEAARVQGLLDVLVDAQADGPELLGERGGDRAGPGPAGSYIFVIFM
jgi:hypothetical protein